MIRLCCSILLATLVLLVATEVDAETRTWTDATGKYKVQAELIDFANNVVRIKRADGKTVSIPLSLLSSADRDYVKRKSANKDSPLHSGPKIVQTGPVVVELLSGSKVSGHLTSRDQAYVVCSIRVGSRTMTRKYPTDRIHAITVSGRREVLHEMPTRTDSAASRTRSLGGTPESRTKAEVESYIEAMGRTPPDWWDSVTLNYPQTLDLSWPIRPPNREWNSQRNVGQYLWDTINPNPTKWREGTRLVHEMLKMHANDSVKLQRDMQTLGRMYYNLLQDYPRAAFWWRKAGFDGRNNSPQSIKLAECYYKLGNKKMALDLLNRTPLYFNSIKLLSDMGETDQALRLAESAAQGDWPDMAYLVAGDTCRLAGKYQEAISYYERVLRVPATGRQNKRIERNHQRARDNIEGIKIYDALDLGRIPDGTYKSASRGFVGDVQVQVVVRDGRIESVKVTGHKEKQFFSSVTETPRKIVERQGVKGVDAVTGATITSEAIVNATAKALASAIK